MSNIDDPLANHFYRVEVFLTTTDKDGVEIPSRNLRLVVSEIFRHFGGLTMTAIEGNPVYDGFWHSTKRNRDMHEKTSIVTVLVPQVPDSLDFFREHKEAWMTALNYEDLLIIVDEVRSI